MKNTSKEHKKGEKRNVKFAVLTVSDSRTKADDESGSTIIETLEANGHSVTKHEVVHDNKLEIINKLREFLVLNEVEAIITSGGTGIAERDVTVEAVKMMYEKELAAFQTLFATLSYEEIGTAALMSRACAGIVKNTPIFSIPGSPRAGKFAVEKLIAKEIGHIMNHIEKNC